MINMYKIKYLVEIKRTAIFNLLNNRLDSCGFYLEEIFSVDSIETEVQAYI